MSQIVGAHCHGTGEEDNTKATEISKNSLELVIPTMSCIQPSIYPIVYAPLVLIWKRKPNWEKRSFHAYWIEYTAAVLSYSRII